MGRLKATLLALALAALAVTMLSACGGSDNPDLLPGETARDINANLNLVEQLASEGDCEGASNAAAAVSEQVEGLSGVDKELKEALTEGAAKLNEVVTECDEVSEEETTPSITEPDEELEEEEQAKDEKAAEREAEKEQKNEEKEEKEVPSNEPPGQEKEEKESEAPPTEPEDGGTPSGGVSPSAPAGGQ